MPFDADQSYVQLRLRSHAIALFQCSHTIYGVDKEVACKIMIVLVVCTEVDYRETRWAWVVGILASLS